MQGRKSLFVVAVSIVAFAWGSVESAAHASVIGTEQYLGSRERQHNIERIDAALARADVRRQLEQLGVNPSEALARVNALSDDELAAMADKLQDLPAGGSLLGVLGIVFVVLIVLDLLGVVDVFKKI
jgi:hypothetical protein